MSERGRESDLQPKKQKEAKENWRLVDGLSWFWERKRRVVIVGIKGYADILVNWTGMQRSCLM
ncbi:hypothetical protein CsSME_00022903 [Camellia sinensis var. sinensis]